MIINFNVLFQVDHTIVLYLIDPKGEFVEYFGQNKTRPTIVDEIHICIAKFKAKNQTGFFS